ncbi:MAG TPA: GAF domain-containing sensor histidine kinase [Arachnia sp.]|nr:GAF domain-containing sensor histidine kinase [Arachnia sp.]
MSPPAQGPQWDVLVGALLACLAAMVFLGFRLVTPAECAWLPPHAGAFSAEGVLPQVHLGCPLPDGSLISHVQVVDGRAEVTVEPDSRSMPLDLTSTAGSLALQGWRAGGTLLFVTALFALCGLAISRRPLDPAAGSSLVFAAALFGSTVVTVAGLPPSWAFTGMLRWLFVANVGFFYTLAWSGMLAWALQFPTPLAPWLRGVRARVLITWAPPLLWGTLAAIGGAGMAFPAWMARAVALQTGFTVVGLSASMGVLILRLFLARRPGSDPVHRQQLLWLGGSGIVAGLLALAFWIVPSLLIGRSLLADELIGVPGLFYVAGMSIAMLRYRLFDLDVVLGRTLVYAALTVVAVSVYLLTVAVLTSLIADQPTGVAVAGAVAVAILVNPVRVRLESWVSRGLYGDRDDPYVALARLAGLLRAREVSWPEVAADLRRALRVPYVSVRTKQSPLAEAGIQPEDQARLRVTPLVHADVTLGSLEVATRGRGGGFAPAERRLLQDLGNQVASALHEQGLDEEVRASRQRLILAREDERRMLRRTLHDDVGPTIAAIPLRTETVRRLMASEATEAVAALLDRIEHDATRAADAVRQLAYDLRPPALDELGLVPALEELAHDLAPLVVHLDTGGIGSPVASLPPAVEVATYRIVSSALANAARHAQAQACWVTLRRVDGTLEVQVADDGVGPPADLHAGVGITAMRERATELGGACTIQPRVDGGTLLRAVLPMAGPS